MMRQNAHIENGDRSTVLMSEWIELNPVRPNTRINRCTITAELWIALALAIALVVLISAWYALDASEEWGVPSPSVEDEAQTAVSQGRVEL